MSAPFGTVELLEYLTPEERAELDKLLESAPIWTPLPGPQSLAYWSEADVIGFGGAAGGGKTDLAVGKALTRFRHTMILRPVGTELTAIQERIEKIIGNDDAYNGKDNIWYLDDRQIELGAIPNAGDEKKYQGRPHDLLVFDEATNFLVTAVRFLQTWVRTIDPDQKCQTLLTFNPPTTAEGRWVIEYFAPWLDPKHPCPALPGELRWFVVVTDAQGNSRDVEVTDGRKRVMVAGELTTDFDPAEFNALDILQPQSRTFIPSRVTDNPYLMGTGYMAQLQSLPEPLRSQMLKGDFSAGMEDDPMQVIPTAWVEAAMARWKPRAPKGVQESVGVDVARGGKDNTIISPRHVGNWYDELKAYPGTQTPDGPTVAGLVIAQLRDSAPIHVDVIGVGASPVDFLREANLQVVPVNVAASATEFDRSGLLSFYNLRSQLWWKMREELDPAHDTGIALPPDARLLADLTAPKWWLKGKTIYVESREQIIDRIGRSPDYGSAVIMANMKTPKIADIDRSHGQVRKPYNPLDRAERDLSHMSQGRNYDPFERMRRG